MVCEATVSAKVVREVKTNLNLKDRVLKWRHKPANHDIDVCAGVEEPDG